MKKMFLANAILLLCLCGCESYICSLKQTFRQAEVVSEVDLSQARAAILSGPVYDYFNTITTLHILWVNPFVEATLQALSEVKTDVGRSPKDSKVARFIVLMDGEKDMWNFALTVQDTIYRPTEYQVFSLTAPYSTLFGKKIMRYKRNVYEIVFPVENLQKPFSISYSNGTYRQTIDWKDIDCVA